MKRFTLAVNRRFATENPVGLRDRQKQDRERRILDAATVQFRNRGFDETHMERIAEQAGLSVGALYNYYRSKGDLLAAIVNVEVTEVLKLGEALVADPPHDVADALDRLVDIYYEHSLLYLDKAMWRHAIALTTRAPETPFARAYTDLDTALARQVADMLRTLQRRGGINADIAADVAGGLVFNNLDRLFQTFVRVEDMSLDALRLQAAAHHRLLADAFTRDSVPLR